VVRRRAFAIGFGVVLAGAWALPAIADQGVQIRSIELKDFPAVGVAISAQGSSGLSPRDVRVLENDVPVTVTSIRPLGPSSDKGIDVVLALDTSNSMRGAPLLTAFAAAREFVSRVPAWVRVGVLTFSDKPQIVQAITSDHAAVLQSLASPPSTTYGTALYDGVTLGASMFSGSAQRNIILLTDGHNTTGIADLHAAAARAHDANATIFAIGLEQARTDVSTLQHLAELTSGTYALASPSDLDAAYRALAQQLSGQFLITYRSRAPLGTQATLRVELPGGSADSGFLAPAPHANAPTASSRTTLERFLQGPMGMATAVGLTFLAAFGLISFLLGMQMDAGRDRQLAQIIPALPRTRASTPVRPEENPLTAWIPQTIVGAAGRVAQYTGLAEGLDARLEQAGLAMRPGEFLAGMALAGSAGILVGGLIGGLASRVLLGALLLGALGTLLPWLLLASVAQKRGRQLQAQLPDVLMVIASSLRAGHSFLQALDMVTKEVGDPSAHEFNRAVTEIRLGRPVNDALSAMAGRIGSEDFEWAVMAINIQRQVGGNLAELLETVAGTIRERDTLRRQVRVLSGEGRLSVIILTVLPILLATYIFLVVPSYIQILFQKTMGLILLVGAGLLMGVGYLWMRKIVKLDV
jgi:tight adherence protein B